MTRYYRPIAQTDAVRPEDALPLAGHAQIWFDRVEVLARQGASELQAASGIPEDVRERLIAPRVAPVGLSFDHPVLMGVLNTTPDSFSDGGRFDTVQTACAHAAEMACDRCRR